MILLRRPSFPNYMAQSVELDMKLAFLHGQTVRLILKYEVDTRGSLKTVLSIER